MPEAISAAALFRYCVRPIEHIQNPLSRHPLALSAVRSPLIHPQVRLDNDSVALVFDKLVVVNASHFSRDCDSTGVVRA